MKNVFLPKVIFRLFIRHSYLVQRNKRNINFGSLLDSFLPLSTMSCFFFFPSNTRCTRQPAMKITERDQILCLQSLTRGYIATSKLQLQLCNPKLVYTGLNPSKIRQEWNLVTLQPQILIREYAPGNIMELSPKQINKILTIILCMFVFKEF